jgi:hypothetical protein
LETVVLDERRLDRAELAAPILDGGDPLALLHHRQGHAERNATAFDMDSACAAVTPLGGQSHGWARGTDPLTLHHGDLLSRACEIPTCTARIFHGK